MPTYSGNLVGQTGSDGTISTGVAANYRRALAPFSNFGTRQLAFFAIACTGANINNTTTDLSTTDENTQGQEYKIGDNSTGVVSPSTYVFPSNSNVYAILNGVAQQMEIAYVGVPAFGGSQGTSTATCTITVGVYIDTAASKGAGMQAATVANPNAQTLLTAVTNSTSLGASAAVTVTALWFSGNTVATGSTAY
jgi:hypothetical protein